MILHYIVLGIVRSMSRKKRRSQDAPMPLGSAGILSFYQEKTDSLIKISPEIVVGLTITIILLVILISVFVPI